MYGSIGGRTGSPAELTAFLFLLKKAIGSIKVHVDHKAIRDGLSNQRWVVERRKEMHRFESW